MSKKSRIKLAIKKAMQPYYKSGMTNTAHTVYTEIIKAVNKAFEPKKK